jgi:hypothetical protein
MAEIEHHRGGRNQKCPYDERVEFLKGTYGEDIVQAMNLLATDPNVSLQHIADQYGVSRERVRQWFPSFFDGASYTEYHTRKIYGEYYVQ